MRFLFIGDPHIRVENFHSVERLLCMVQRLTADTPVDEIVVAGDVLHNHERLHTLALNRAVDFLETLAGIAPVVCLVGNHDMINNQQFLTHNHWLHHYRGRLGRVEVVDAPTLRSAPDGTVSVYCPYVFPGRFQEALSARLGDAWRGAHLVFAHQEFRGAKMGAIVSEDGDPWDPAYPQVVSGHIHDYQRPLTNVFYPGTPMQQSFGDRGGNIVLLVECEGGALRFTEVPTDVDTKRTVYASVEDVAKLVEGGIKSTEEEQVKVAVKGTAEEFKVFKESKEYKQLVESGVKVAFKQEAKARPTLDMPEFDATKEGRDFESILTELLASAGSTQVLRDYREVFYNIVFEDADA